MKFSSNEINKILGLINLNGSLENSFNFNKVSIDSRNISSDDLFIAIKGDKYDGHDFIKDSLKKGVKAVVINQGKQNLVPKKYPFWMVSDTKEAYQNLALLKRRKLNILVIAITGSVGKTTTKEMCSEVLKNYGKIKVSERNNNNEIGVAKTIHSCDGSENLLVLEMGMRGIGQIETLSKYSEPDIAVITNIGSSHIGILGSRTSIAQAKCEIARYLNPKGLVIIPYGDSLLDEYLKKSWSGRVVKVKIEQRESNNSFVLKDEYLLGLFDNLNNLIEIDNKKFEISFKGIHNALDFLYIYAISKELGLKFKNFNRYKFKILDGRNKVIKTDKITIMDETYNASPESVKACIKVLLDYPGRHFLILGSMQELGDKSLKYHKEIIQLIKKSDIVKFILLCENDLKESLQKSSLISNNIFLTDELDNIAPLINKLTQNGDYLLIKGSRSWQLDKLISLID